MINIDFKALNRYDVCKKTYSAIKKHAVMTLTTGLLMVAPIATVTSAQAAPSANLQSSSSHSVTNQSPPSSDSGVNAFLHSLSPQEQEAYESFQNNSDIIRLHHLKYWVELIEEYHRKTGEYPFQNQSERPIIVFVASPIQQRYTQIMGYEVPKGMAEFVSILEKGLGRQIDEYYDPQYAPDFKPNYYLYMIEGDSYYFAIHTHQSYDFSRQVATYYNKVEVSNVHTDDAPYILTADTLFNSDAYHNATHKKVERLEFFKEREALTLHATKE